MIMAQETGNVDYESMVDKYMNEWEGCNLRICARAMMARPVSMTVVFLANKWKPSETELMPILA